MVEELNQRGRLVIIRDEVHGPQGFDSYSLLSLQYEWIDSRRDNLSTDLVVELARDPFLVRTAGPETMHRLPFLSNLDEWLHGLDIRLVDLDYVDLGRIDGLPAEGLYANAHNGDEDHSAFIDLRDTLTRLYTNLSSQQRSVATYLTNISNFFLYSLRWAAGGCTPAEFGAAFAASRSTVSTAAGRVAKAETAQAETYATRALRYVELASVDS